MIKNGMRAIHPGEILREEFLRPLGMTPFALSKELNVPPARVNEIVNEHRGVSPDTALRLARYFGGDAESWLNMQQAYDLKLAQKKNLRSIAREIKPRAAEIGANDAKFAVAG